MDHTFARSRHLIERYVLDELAPAEAAEFEDHLFDCPQCADDVLQAERFLANLRALFSTGPAIA